MGSKNDFIKYINLNVLPRRKNGKIDWQRSAGYSVPFVYGEISGNIYLVEYILKKRTFKVLIDGYTKFQYDTASIDTLKQCQLGRLLHKKIIDTNPEMVQYFVNKDDALKHSYQSNIRIKTQCPFCGYVKDQIISNLYQFGFGCPQCSDGVSYPNKLMFNILKQLDICFKNEVTKRDEGFEWVEEYRYDFYFEKDGQKYFIEMDGHFHQNHSLICYNQVVQADKKKDQLAREHNINIIRIDCCYNKESDKFNFIKYQILNSVLYNILDLSKIDWDIANQSAISSNVYLAAQYWNDGDVIKQIAEKIGVSTDTIRSYLKIAADINLCDYNKETSEQRRIKACILAKSKNNNTKLIKRGCENNEFISR